TPKNMTTFGFEERYDRADHDPSGCNIGPPSPITTDGFSLDSHAATSGGNRFVTGASVGMNRNGPAPHAPDVKSVSFEVSAGDDVTGNRKSQTLRPIGRA